MQVNNNLLILQGEKMGDDWGNDDENLQMGAYFDKWTEKETRCQTREQGEHTDAEKNTWLF